MDKSPNVLKFFLTFLERAVLAVRSYLIGRIVCRTNSPSSFAQADLK